MLESLYEKFNKFVLTVYTISTQ